MQERFAAEKADVAHSSITKNLQGSLELIGIDPSQVLAFHFAVGEVAEITSGVAGISDSNIAQRRTATSNEAQHVPSRRPHVGHDTPLEPPVSAERSESSPLRSFVHTGLTRFRGM